MSDWQNLLVEGNQQYNKGEWRQAEQLYLSAEESLDKSWNQDQTNTELLMAWICATHNLATVYEKQGDNRVSLQYLIFPHQRMLKLSQGKHNNNELTMVAIKALKITLTPIIEYRKKHTLCQECYNALTDLKTFKERQDIILKNYH